MTTPLHKTHALETVGSSRICWIPFFFFGLPVICNRDARINVGSLASSVGSDGIDTKCRISAAEVPIYRLSSAIRCQLLYEETKDIILTPVFYTCNMNLPFAALRLYRDIVEQLTQDIGCCLGS